MATNESPRSRRSMLTASITCALGLVLLFADVSAAATPRAGWLDTSFASHGLRVIAGGYPGGDISATADLAVAPSGRIFTAAYHNRGVFRSARIAVTAYARSGAVATTFNGGRPVVVFEFPDSSECCGMLGPFPTAEGGVEAGWSTAASGEIWKYTATGSPDPPYGTGGRAPIQDSVMSATRLPGGSIRAVTVSVFGEDGWHLVGLTPTGDPDLRVGVGGRRMLTTPAQLLSSDSRGRLYLTEWDDATSDLTVRRTSSSGNADPTWGSAGVARITLPPGERGPESIRVASTGAVFITLSRPDAVTRRPQVLIIKLSPTGAPDNSFGSGGTLVVPAPSGSSRSGVLEVDGSGRLLLGFVDRGASLQPYLARLNSANGALDRTFGHGGLVPVANAVIAIAPTAGGKLLTVSRVVRDGRYTLVLARRFG